MIVLQLTFENVNVSVQAGDTCCYISNPPTQGGFTYANSNNEPMLVFGEVLRVSSPTTLDILYDDINNPNPPPNPINDFIFCIKDKSVNSSSLLGYYLEADFKNNSKEFAELFSVGSEVVESSK